MSNDFTFTEKYSYQYLDLLRSFKGKFDKATKTWSLPESCKSEFLKEKDKIDRQNKKIIQDKWAQALKENNYTFVKKNTLEYEEVYKTFKELL
jgi:hypothetical protein